MAGAGPAGLARHGFFCTDAAGMGFPAASSPGRLSALPGTRPGRDTVLNGSADLRTQARASG